MQIELSQLPNIIAILGVVLSVISAYTLKTEGYQKSSAIMLIIGALGIIASGALKVYLLLKQNCFR